MHYLHPVFFFRPFCLHIAVYLAYYLHNIQTKWEPTGATGGEMLIGSL